MDIWKQCTLRANTEFELSRFGNAILMHNQALDYAIHQLLTTQSNDKRHFLDKVLISYFSLADCYSSLGLIDRATDFYLQAQRFILNISSELCQCAQPTNEISDAANHLHILWLQLADLHGEIPYTRQLAYFETQRELIRRIEEGAVKH